MTCRVIHKLQMTFRQDVNKFSPTVTTLNKAKALSNNVRASTIQKAKRQSKNEVSLISCFHKQGLTFYTWLSFELLQLEKNGTE